jgi:hypothetical protein
MAGGVGVDDDVALLRGVVRPRGVQRERESFGAASTNFCSSRCSVAVSKTGRDERVRSVAVDRRGTRATGPPLPAHQALAAKGKVVGKLQAGIDESVDGTIRKRLPRREVYNDGRMVAV